MNPVPIAPAAEKRSAEPPCRHGHGGCQRCHGHSAGLSLPGCPFFLPEQIFFWEEDDVVMCLGRVMEASQVYSCWQRLHFS